MKLHSKNVKTHSVKQCSASVQPVVVPCYKISFFLFFPEASRHRSLLKTSGEEQKERSLVWIELIFFIESVQNSKSWKVHVKVDWMFSSKSLVTFYCHPLFFIVLVRQLKRKCKSLSVCHSGCFEHLYGHSQTAYSKKFTLRNIFQKRAVLVRAYPVKMSGLCKRKAEQH